MPNITKIKSKDNHSNNPAAKKHRKKSKPKIAPKATKTAPKTTKPVSKKPNLLIKILRTPFIPFRPIARYIKASWQEIRQVRWPNRKLTWKMTFAVIVYTAVFIIFIATLDALFTFVFNNLLTN
jgi:preprotein translocase SecE subunit